MKITIKLLEKFGACEERIDFHREHFSESAPLIDILTKSINEKDSNEYKKYSCWLLSCLMTRKQQISFAIYCARLVLDIFEKEYPNDKRCDAAIKAASRWIKNPSEKNRWSAELADREAYQAAYDAAGVGYIAIDCDLSSASAAAYAAYYAAGAAGTRSVLYARRYANEAANEALAADCDAFKKIIGHGLKVVAYNN